MAEPLRVNCTPAEKEPAAAACTAANRKPQCLVPAQEHVATRHEGESFRMGSAAFQLPGLWGDASSSVTESNPWGNIGPACGRDGRTDSEGFSSKTNRVLRQHRPCLSLPWQSQPTPKYRCLCRTGICLLPQNRTVQLTVEGHSVKTLGAFHYVLLESQVPFLFRLNEHPLLQVKMTDGWPGRRAEPWNWTDTQLFTGPNRRLSSGQYFSSPGSSKS